MVQISNEVQDVVGVSEYNNILEGAIEQLCRLLGVAGGSSLRCGSTLARTEVFGPTPFAFADTMRTAEDIFLLSSPIPSSLTTTWSERNVDGPPAQAQKRGKHHF
jgi:hypothetical protein